MKKFFSVLLMTFPVLLFSQTLVPPNPDPLEVTPVDGPFTLSDSEEKKAGEEQGPAKAGGQSFAKPVEEERKDYFNLSYYEPMYLLWGNPVSRVNFSFKYQFIRDFPVYLGFVQNIFWLLGKESNPFLDANFNPRLFYRLYFHKDDLEDYLDIIPFEHKSNGKSEPESRSFDGSGMKVNWRFVYENWSFKTYAKGLWRYHLDPTNKDLEQYVGPFEVGLAISQFTFDWLDRGEITYRAYTGGEWGEKFNRMSHEVGFSFRIFGSRLTPAFYVQYFNGYSESLLRYNEREENIRVGLLL